jgi:hypothetical protein
MLRKRGIICLVRPTVFMHVYPDHEQCGKRRMNTKKHCLLILCNFLSTFAVLFLAVAVLQEHGSHRSVLDSKYWYLHICKGFYFRLKIKSLEWIRNLLIQIESTLHARQKKNCIQSCPRILSIYLSIYLSIRFYDSYRRLPETIHWFIIFCFSYPRPEKKFEN